MSWYDLNEMLSLLLIFFVRSFAAFPCLLSHILFSVLPEKIQKTIRYQSKQTMHATSYAGLYFTSSLLSYRILKTRDVQCHLNRQKAFPVVIFNLSDSKRYYFWGTIGESVGDVQSSISVVPANFSSNSDTSISPGADRSDLSSYHMGIRCHGCIRCA